MLLISALYCSRATLPWTPEGFRSEIDEIMESASRNNAAFGLTGALIYDRGRFVQVLEGPRSAVSAMLTRIAADERHDAMVIAEVAEIDKRAYGDWSMGFVDAATAPAEVPRLPDFGVAPAEALHAHIRAVLDSPVRVRLAA